GSGLLSQVKLPYPTVSLMANMGPLDDQAAKKPCTSSNGILRTGAYASSLDPNRHMTEGSLLTG
ncbi:unnamed protein product, partial [Trichobilharzia szidati]